MLGLMKIQVYLINSHPPKRGFEMKKDKQNEKCKHENIGVNQIWENGELIKSEVVCDDCGKVLKNEQ